MEALPAIGFSIICELFIKHLLGILSNGTATHMVHFYMSLLVSCIYTFALVLLVWNNLYYDVTKLQLLNTKHVYLTNTCLILSTAVITQYLRNSQNIHDQYLI